MDEHILRAGVSVILGDPATTATERELLTRFYGERFGETPDGYLLRNHGSATATSPLLERICSAAAKAPPCAYPHGCARPAARDGWCVPHWRFSYKRGWAAL